jgi:hypothetical protein
LKVTAGDYNQGQAGEMLEEANAPEAIVRSYRKLAAGRRTLVFTPTVATAQAVADEFTAAGLRAALVSGDMPLDARRDVLARYSRGEIDVVSNCMVLTEGYDEPRTDCIIVARPTKSRALYTQMIGRGTRRHPDKGDCLVIDVVGATDMHDLVTVPSLFGIEKPQKVWCEGDDCTGASVVDALHEQVEEHAAAGRLLATEARLFDKVRSTGKMAWVTVHMPGKPRRYELNLGRRSEDAPNQRLVLVEIGDDRWRAGCQEDYGRGVKPVKRVLLDDVPLEVAQGVAEDYARKAGATALVATDARWRKARPTLKQRDRLKKWGVSLPPGATKGDASDLINEYIARRQHRKAPT